jgi:glycopeptide antibiotics resistance protein
MKYLKLAVSIDMGIILYIVAVVLFIPLTFINFFVVLWNYGLKWSTINGFFYETAVDIDRFANRNFRTLWNVTLRLPHGYKFGNINETVSSALGKNKRDNTLTKAGRVLCAILDFLDKNHCIKSINNNV